MMIMDKTKKIKIALVFVILIILGVVLVLVLKSRQEPGQEIPTAPIPADQTDFVETVPRPFLEKLPYDGQTFFIDYPEFDIYTVYLRTADTEQAKKAVYEWFINQGAKLEELKIRFITESDEDVIERIIGELPVEEPNFEIWVSAKTNTFVVTVLGTSFAEGKQEAVAWFEKEGLSDLSQVNILWEDQTGD